MSANPETMHTQRPRLNALRLEQVIARVALKKSAIYARMAAGTFPRSFKQGSATCWYEHEIDAYLENLGKQRDSQPE